ncbi:MAG: DUF2156 domain-containing protein [Ruminococcaceae bacterium]|nr:DUF2156 domain-containing protein [Oscillospiraceae bacterium]
MIDSMPLTLKSKEVVSPYFKNITNSVYNFTTAFLWGGEKHVKYSIIDGSLVLFYEYPKSPICASYPLGDGDKRNAIISACDYMKSKGVTPVFRNLSPFMADELKSLFPNKFEYIPDRNAFDYIYETKKLIDLSGKELHSKRNHYNYFKKTYNYKYYKMTQDDTKECKALFDKWIEGKERTRWLEVSREATFKALDNLDELGLTGGMIKVGREICAFSLGEAVSSDTALIHFEVALSSLRGAFNAINCEFCANEWKNFTYVNREEDMGIENLRKTKEAYRPVFLLEKINAVLKNPF